MSKSVFTKGMITFSKKIFYTVLPTNFKAILPDQPKSSAAGEKSLAPQNMY
jgi:hypothetical protein